MSYRMTEAEEEMWARWCGSWSDPSEFAEDDPGTIDAALWAVVTESHGSVPDDVAEEAFDVLREIVRNAVGK